MSRNPAMLILYNQPATEATFAASEAGVLAEVEAVVNACQYLQQPCRAMGVRTYDEVVDVLAGADETVVFNLVEGFADHPEQVNFVPALCTALNKVCTGNSTQSLLLSLNKWQSKAVLRAGGCPCPEAVLVAPGQGVPPKGLFAGPYLVKPLSADASEGIDRDSVVASSGRRLNAAVARVHEQFHQPALIEQFIDGRELNVSILWQADEPRVLPLAEIDFSAFEANRPRIVGYEAKWDTNAFEYNHTPRVIPAPLPKRCAETVRNLAIQACRVLGCNDYCRVDFRLDADLHPYVLEVNANPDISPDAGFAAALEAAGIAYHEFVRWTLNNAFSRLPSIRARTKTPARHSGDVSIRWCEPKDRLAILAVLAGTRLFRCGELDIAREILDDAYRDGPEGHYQSFVAEKAGRVVGWVCFGPTPCTLGTWDLYWIAVDVEVQGCGLGRALMTFAEDAMRKCGAQRVVVETSGRSSYESTRCFYRRLGYNDSIVVPDFYGPADDKVITIKTFSD